MSVHSLSDREHSHLAYDFQADYLPDDCAEQHEVLDDVTDDELSPFCSQPLEDDKDYEPLDDSSDDPSYCPLFQDMEHDEPLRGRAVKCAQRICHDFFRGDDWADREFIANVQQEAYLYLWEHRGKEVSNKLLDANVKERINCDWEKFHPHRTRKETAADTTGNGKQLYLKRAAHDVEFISKPWLHDTYESARQWEVAELLDVGKTVPEIAERLGVSESTVHRAARAIRKRRSEEDQARKKRRPGDPRPERRLPWNAVKLKLPNVQPRPAHIKPDDWPTPQSRLYSMCHCRCESDERLIDRFLAGNSLNGQEQGRLRELAYNFKHY